MNGSEQLPVFNPQLFAFIASQNRLGANVLFSHKKIADLIDPALKTKKSRWSAITFFRVHGLKITLRLNKRK